MLAFPSASLPRVELRTEAASSEAPVAKLGSVSCATALRMCLKSSAELAKDVRSFRIRRLYTFTRSHPFIARDTHSCRRPATIATSVLKLFNWKHFFLMSSKKKKKRWQYVSQTGYRYNRRVNGFKRTQATRMNLAASEGRSPGNESTISEITKFVSRLNRARAATSALVR